MTAELASTLLRASLEGALAVAAVAAASLLLARRAPATRCALWWIASLKLLVALAGLAPLTLPILPAALSATPRIAQVLPATPDPAAPSPTSTAGFPWREIAVTTWLAFVALGAGTSLIRLARTRRVLRRARPVPDDRTLVLFVRLCESLELRRIPKLRVSPEVSTPQVVGALSPTVLLPQIHLERFSEEDLAMALCHELVHVRRRDLGFGWVPAIAERLFFFHPAALLAARQYALAREEACDAEVLRILGASPRRYGRLLVEMCAAASPSLVPAASVSSSFLHLRRRLRMLEHAPDRRHEGTFRWAAVALLAAAIVVPVRLAARPPSDADRAVKEAAERDAARASSWHGTEDAYVFLMGDTSMMSGDLRDLDRARAARGKDAGDFLWFRQDGKEYVVRDPVVLRTIRAIHTALDALDPGEDELSKQQEQMGERQESLAREQEKAAERLAVLERKREALEEGVLEKSQGEIERLDAETGHRAEQVAKLEMELERLSASMDALGADQERRAQEMERASVEIERKIHAIIEESIESGVAERIRPAI